jgi:hypothetical protein
VCSQAAKRIGCMRRMFVDPVAVYLYLKTVEFGLQFNGLALIVALMLGVLIFTNRTRKGRSGKLVTIVELKTSFTFSTCLDNKSTKTAQSQP